MFKEKLVLIGIVLGALLVMVLSFEKSSQFPYLTTVIIIFITSLVCFFTFMNEISHSWFKRGLIINSILVVLIPIIEGMDFLFVTVCFLVILTFTQLAVFLVNKK